MKIGITARHFELGEDLRDHVERRFNRLGRYNRRVSRIEVTLTEEKRERRVEALAFIDRDIDIHAEAAAEDFRVAVNAVTEKLARQLKRRQDRKSDHQGPRLGEEIQADEPQGTAEGET